MMTAVGAQAQTATPATTDPTTSNPATTNPAPTNPGYTQAQPAPIERVSPQAGAPMAPNDAQQPGQPQAHRMRVRTEEPAQGIWVSSAPGSLVSTVTATADRVELRVDRGLVNVTVHHPAENSLILVDFAGGQVDLIKDGFYTFNPQTKTFRVLVGEAAAYPTTAADTKPLTVKENHALVFGEPQLRSVNFEPMQARTDVLPGRNRADYGDGQRSGYAYEGYPAFGFGYGYPYYAWGDPFWGPGFGWGDPFWGPGFGYGVGLGWGGGFYGGGGWHGGGWHGGGRR